MADADAEAGEGLAWLVDTVVVLLGTQCTPFQPKLLSSERQDFMPADQAGERV